MVPADSKNVLCPRCTHDIPLRPEYGGRTIYCPRCGGPIALGGGFAGFPPTPAPQPASAMIDYAAAGGLRYAGFWIRAVAHLVDALVLLIPSMIAGAVLPFLGGLIVYFLYEGLLVAKWEGQTVGRRVCGIRVVGGDGQPISDGQAFGRAAARILSTLVLFIGHLMIPFDRQKRGLHDHIAKTLTVYCHERF